MIICRVSLLDEWQLQLTQSYPARTAITCAKTNENWKFFCDFCIIFDFEFETDHRNKSAEETAAISKEKALLSWRQPSPKKGLTYEKSFVLPLVDSNEHPKFRELNILGQCLRPQKVPMACWIFDVSKF